MKKILLSMLCLLAMSTATWAADAPRVVNIINFIRGVEPRDNGVITEDILFNTVAEQAKCLSQRNLCGTYLLMYNALVIPRYQTLMKQEMSRGCEVGGWWEISQPQCEAAGVKWRADVPWLHHADVGFSIGYTQQERALLVDAYMKKFQEIFGSYPTSVGSWFIDAYTLGYMYDKYGIQASCICRDQVGTDGYTMWGGYWTGGYYPSRQNTYMPAQTRKEQINVPVFRMLGSDPIYQYDAGLGINVWQSVRTLEPTCTEGGGDPKWCDWYFQTVESDPALALSYTQMGQENSFTWNRFGKAFTMQADKLVALKAAGKIRLETLGETGKWFLSNFKLTPASAQSALTDYTPNDNRTLWFNSRYFRTNLVWEGNHLKIRDIHLFSEQYASRYLTNPCTTAAFQYFTLPLVDGNLWSTAEQLAALRFYAINGSSLTEIAGREPMLTSKGKTMVAEWPLENGGCLILKMTDSQLSISGPKNMEWCAELRSQPAAETPFTAITANTISAQQEGFGYSVKLAKGTCQDLRSSKNGQILRLIPRGGQIVLKMN